MHVFYVRMYAHPAANEDDEGDDQAVRMSEAALRSDLEAVGVLRTLQGLHASGAVIAGKNPSATPA